MARFLLLFALSLWGLVAAAQTSLQGKITEEETGEPLIGAYIVLNKNGVFVTGTSTDIDGNFNIPNVDPGTYDVEVSYTGFQRKQITGIRVLAGKANRVDATLSSEAVTMEAVEVVDYKVPLVEQDNTTQGAVITSENIRNLPTRNINAIAATTAGIAQSDEGGALAIRGSRTDATDYYVDGIRVQGNLIPESEIDQLQVITGGVEARYGDVTGGIISITTKGPSNTFSGGAEVETSSPFDPYNQNLVGLNLTGPILRNKKGQSVLGYRFAGRYTFQRDDDPPATDIFVARDDVLADLQANPVIEREGERFVAADFMTEEDVQILDYNPNENLDRIDLTGKIDARLSDAIDLTLTGAVSIIENQFTPGNVRSSNALNTGWQLLNNQNNPTRHDDTYRGNFRFRHRLGVNADQTNSVVQNAVYTLQAGFERRRVELSDPRHGDDYFRYGYIGDFDFDYVPTFSVEADTVTGILSLQHRDYFRVLRNVEYSDANPVLVNYNNVIGLDLGEPLNPDIPDFIVGDVISDLAAAVVSEGDFLAFNSQFDNVFASSWNFHRNVGAVFNLNQDFQEDVFTFQANASFDLVFGGSDKGRHTIELGAWFEQRTLRNYSINPLSLWTIARQQANNHILGIPFDEDGQPATDSIGVITGLDINIGGQQIDEATLYDVAIAPDPEAVFYKELRRKLGVSNTTFVNVDGVDPDLLSLDMFTAREVRDVLAYYGYDYLGNPFNGNFEDFFTATRNLEDGTPVRTFPVAPNRPIYTAFYLQDKFTFRDIIFRVGVRVDRYDANTQVLKDPYSLYEIMGADQYHTEFGGERPGNVGGDYKVYLDQEGSTVQAYRNGDNWFTAEGTPVNDPFAIFGQTGRVNPVYLDPNARGNNNYIRQFDYDPDASFEDYEVQVNVMPRLAFSFPISDEANFFAHYDVLVQRPPSNTIATPLQFFNFPDRSFTAGNPLNNPNLLPEKTVDYEVGFQQKITNTSALKISAYYKEMRDMIQLRTFQFVAGNSSGEYTTYDNQDFGTVKGFSLQYDLRRTGNFSLQANYTLQFADGTGSDPNSQAGLTNRGTNLRDLAPLNFDERHRIVATADYRYGSGRRYNGPRIGGVDILSNFGINLQGIFVSGRPYTPRREGIELGGRIIDGSINGARLPANITVNLRVDKQFRITDKLGLNVYIRVQNLLDRRNVLNVYTATGSPTDDGFLVTPDGQRRIAEIQSSARNLEAYLASYRWARVNPDFFTLPRRTYLGAIVNF